jgi:hypothetical protein
MRGMARNGKQKAIGIRKGKIVKKIPMAMA